MKKLFALLFSFQLIVTPVFAADAQNVPGVEEDAYLKTGTGSKGGYDYYVNQILVLGTSAIGSSIISQCLMGLKVPSIATFMGGSLVHMMAEIAGAKAKNQNHQNRMKDIKIKTEELKKSGGTAQKMAMDQRLIEEEDTKKFLKNRKNWMLAVTTIYTASAGLAIAEEFYGTASSVSLNSTSCASLLTLAPACIGQFILALATLHGNFSHSQAANLADKMCIGTGYVQCKAALQVYLLAAFGACKEVPTDGGASMISWNTALSLAYGFGSSKVGSSAGGVAQYGSMIISLLGMLVPSLSKMVVPMYNMPIPRAATFGAAAVLTGTVTAGLAKRENIAEDNIKQLKNVIAQFKENTEGDSGVGVDGLGSGTDEEITDNIKIKNNLKPMVETKKVECLTKGANGYEHSAAGCAKPMKLTKTDLGKFNLPGISNVSNLTTDLANAMASGNDAQAGKIAGEIGSFAARVNKEVADLKAAYNEQQKKEKKEPHDFDKSVKDQIAGMQASFDKASAQSKIAASDLGAPDTTSDSEKAPADAPVVTTAATAPVPEIPADPFAGMGGTEELTLPEAKTVAAAQSLDEFESTEQDIAKTPETSIFKQLSNRYILNYKKMFETKKSLDQSPAPTN